MVNHAYIQNRSTFPSGRKVITLQEKKKKVEPWKQWPLKFSGNMFTENNARANWIYFHQKVIGALHSFPLSTPNSEIGMNN